MTTPASTPPAPDPGQFLIQLATGYMVSGSIQIAVKLGVADRLAAGPQAVSALAAQVHANEDALYRVLRALSMVGVFTEPSPRTFALTPVGELLRSDRPGLHDMALWITSPFHFRLWANAMHTMQTGEPSWEKTTGLQVFDYFAKDQELSAIFNHAMTSFSAMVVPAVIDAYSFEGIEVLVDVAGGHGQLLTSILQKHPRMRGILSDVEHVIEGAGPTLTAMNCADRCQTVALDFFKAVPAGGDAYMMKHIIHDWDDERALQILRNVHTALAGKPNGRLLLVEGVVPPGDTPDFSKLIDLEMLLTPGGRERTAEEFRALLANAGFEMTRIVPTPGPVSVIEARPR